MVVRGQLQYLGFVRKYDRVYQGLARKLAERDPTFAPTLPTTPEPGEIVYATEGPSDPLHFEAALRSFREAGDFTELAFRAVAHKVPKNDEQLWSWLNEQSATANAEPRVGIFDCDAEYATRLGESGWRHFGNGVVGRWFSPRVQRNENARFGAAANLICEICDPAVAGDDEQVDDALPSRDLAFGNEICSPFMKPIGQREG